MGGDLILWGMLQGATGYSTKVISHKNKPAPCTFFGHVISISDVLPTKSILFIVNKICFMIHDKYMKIYTGTLISKNDAQQKSSKLSRKIYTRSDGKKPLCICLKFPTPVYIILND
jgi:hypothetical protein